MIHNFLSFMFAVFHSIFHKNPMTFAYKPDKLKRKMRFLLMASSLCGARALFYPLFDSLDFQDTLALSLSRSGSLSLGIEFRLNWPETLLCFCVFCARHQQNSLTIELMNIPTSLLNPITIVVFRLFFFLLLL